MGHIRLRVARAVLAGVVAGAAIAPGLLLSASQAEADKAKIQERLVRIRADLFAGTTGADQAVRALKDILAVDPGSAEAHLLLGIAYRTLGAADLMGEAVAELRQALALNPAFVPARFYLAHIYLDLGRRERAREELEAALVQTPGNPQFLTLLGEVERQLNNPRRALEVLKQALQIDESSAQGHYYLGLALLDLEQPAEAIKELERVVKSGEKRADVYLSLGVAYLDSGRLDEGLEILSQATHLDASRPDTRVQLARAYRLKGMLDKAEAQLAIGMPQGPASVSSPFVQQRQLEYDLYLEQGLLKLQQGQLKAAIDALQKVLEIDPDHGPANRYLAEVYLRQGRYAQALDYSTRAEKLGFPLPSDKRKLLEDLQKQKKETGVRK
jgi:tetratricopeptide (TPR) repeat protein